MGATSAEEYCDDTTHPSKIAPNVEVCEY